MKKTTNLKNNVDEKKQSDYRFPQLLLLFLFLGIVMLFFLKNARRKKQQCGNFQVDHTPLQLCAPGCYYISVKLLETAAIIWILFTTLTYDNKNSIGHGFQLSREAWLML